jgi:hypothetical protein
MKLIRALLEGRAYDLATKELGVSSLTASSYAQVFTVSRTEIDAYVVRNGLPSNRYHTTDSFTDGIHLLFHGGVWLVYDREREIKFNEQTFTSEEMARNEIVTMLLRISGTGLKFA